MLAEPIHCKNRTEKESESDDQVRIDLELDQRRYLYKKSIMFESSVSSGGSTHWSPFKTTSCDYSEEEDEEEELDDIYDEILGSGTSSKHPLSGSSILQKMCRWGETSDKTATTCQESDSWNESFNSISMNASRRRGECSEIFNEDMSDDGLAFYFSAQDSLNLLTSNDVLDRSTSSSSLSSIASLGLPTSTSVASSTETSRQSRVRFGTVEIREYAVIIGDNPSCRGPCALELDWRRTESRFYDAQVHASRRRSIALRSSTTPCLTTDERHQRVAQVNGWTVARVLQREQLPPPKEEKTLGVQSPIVSPSKQMELLAPRTQESLFYWVRRR